MLMGLTRSSPVSCSKGSTRKVLKKINNQVQSKSEIVVKKSHLTDCSNFVFFFHSKICSNNPTPKMSSYRRKQKKQPFIIFCEEMQQMTPELKGKKLAQVSYSRNCVGIRKVLTQILKIFRNFRP